MTRLIRIVVGIWNAAARENVYQNLPSVNLTPQNLRPEAQAAGAG